MRSFDRRSFLSRLGGVVGGAASVLGLSATQGRQAFAHGGDASTEGGSATSIDATLTAQLKSTAAGLGSDLVAYRDPVAPAYLKVTSDILAGQIVSLFRFVAASKRSSIQAYTNADDHTPALQEALNVMNGRAPLDLEYGRWNVSQKITAKQSSIIGRGFRSTPGAYTIAQGCWINYTGNETLFEFDGAAQPGGVIERMQLSGFAAYCKTLKSGSKFIHVKRGRHFNLSNLYAARFDVAYDFEDQSWAGCINQLQSFGHNIGIRSNSGGFEDSGLSGLVMRGYSANSVGLWLNYANHPVLITSSDFSNNGIGCVISNGINPHGEAYSAAAQFINCQWEIDRAAEEHVNACGIQMTSAYAGGADGYPSVRVQGGRMYGYGVSAGNDVPFIRAEKARSIIVDDIRGAGFNHLIYTAAAENIGSIDLRAIQATFTAELLGGQAKNAEKLEVTSSGAPRAIVNARRKQQASGVVTDHWLLDAVLGEVSGSVFLLTISVADGNPGLSRTYIATPKGFFANGNLAALSTGGGAEAAGLEATVVGNQIKVAHTMGELKAILSSLVRLA